MKTLSIAAAAGLLTTAVAGGLVVSAARAGQTLSYDVTFHDTVLTAKTDGLSLGDRFILDDVLLQGGKQVGTSSGLCTITNINGIAICNVTFSVPGGTLSAQFINAPPPKKDFAITGGTGAYANVIGVGVMIENGDNTGTLTLTLP